MTEYVRIKISDDDGNILHHHYLRVDAWDLPGGIIQPGEHPRDAAARELLERTGYSIDPNHLEDGGREGTWYFFAGHKKDLQKTAQPGEKGGYATEIRWKK